MFVCLLELSVEGKTNDTENGRDNYKRIPKSVRRDVHKGKSWPQIGAQANQVDLMER